MNSKRFFFSVVASAVLGVTAMAAPKQVEIEITKAYVPVGFDDNDNSQIVIQGFFNNTCYKIGPYSTQIDEATKTIRFRQTAYEYGFECLQIMVPFTQIVDMGLLTAGQWKLSDAHGGRPLGDLPIDRAHTTAPDDYLYANVTDAYVRGATGTTAPATLAVEGEFTDRCSMMKEIRVHYYPEVVVVQPIMEQVKNRANCGPARNRFEYKVELKAALKGTFLLHVRSLSGKAVNKLVWLP